MAYHWCKECAYRPDGIIKTVRQGKQELIEFFCPKDAEKERGTLYYKSDFDKYKISCPGWEPLQYQMNLVKE